MCDQDHFDDDRKEYEARGLVSRREFGVNSGIHARSNGRPRVDSEHGFDGNLKA